jgi:hypothetical protein
MQLSRCSHISSNLHFRKGEATMFYQLITPNYEVVTGNTTGSPSSVYVAFIRVCMGIFNDSLFGKNTWVKELKLTMCLPWFIGYVCTKFRFGRDLSYLPDLVGWEHMHYQRSQLSKLWVPCGLVIDPRGPGFWLQIHMVSSCSELMEKVNPLEMKKNSRYFEIKSWIKATY